jgi:alkylation response protein AidB-like acyl-CoA dehydrogenase
LPNDQPLVPAEQAHMAQQFFDRRKLTIYGGSAEIQRNIIARQIVGV